MKMHPDVIRRLREGKAALREERRRASIDEKLAELCRAQHLYVQIVGSRRPLSPLERPWGDVRLHHRGSPVENHHR